MSKNNLDLGFFRCENCAKGSNYFPEKNKFLIFSFRYYNRPFHSFNEKDCYCENAKKSQDDGGGGGGGGGGWG